LVVGHASAQGWFRPKSVSDRFNKAVEYYNEGRYGAAESALNKILVKDPNEFEEAVRFMLIKTKYQSGDTETARILAVNYLNNPGYVAYERFVIEALADIFVQEEIILLHYANIYELETTKKIRFFYPGLRKKSAIYLGYIFHPIWWLNYWSQRETRLTKLSYDL